MKNALTDISDDLHLNHAERSSKRAIVLYGVVTHCFAQSKEVHMCEANKNFNYS